MVLDASLLSTQHYKVRIKGKVEQSRKGVAPSPTHWCSSYRKGSLRVTLDYGRQLYLLTCLSSRQTSVWPIYISTNSSLVIPSSIIHFNACVCWLEIRVQITRVAIGTFFYITPPLLSWPPLESIIWSLYLFRVGSTFKNSVEVVFLCRTAEVQ